MECYERIVICEHDESPNNKRGQLNLFISHRAALRKIPTKEGFTHDWMVMLTGDDGVKVHDLIDKVVFRLHNTFPNPKRGFKHPPYQLIESGYGGFNLPIDVHFKTDEEPKSIRFMYTLYLGVTPSVSHRRCEKIIFHNPSRSFLEKLYSSGATFIEPTLQIPPTNLFRSNKRPLSIEKEFQIEPQIKKRSIINDKTDDQLQKQYCKTSIKDPVKSVIAKKRGRPRKKQKPLDENKENLGRSVQEQNFQILNVNESMKPLSPVNNSQFNLSLSMNSFIRNIQNDPSMASTPISSRSILKNSSAPVKKSNLKLRFKSFVEEYSLGDDEKVILQENMHEYRKKLKDNYAETPAQFMLGQLQNLPADRSDPTYNASSNKNNELVILQRMLMTITEKKVLKKVVKIIDEAGHLKTTQNSIDFDLCALDDVTLTKVRQCLFE